MQFIHQSVQDLCLDKGLSVLHNSLEAANINLYEPGFAGLPYCSLSSFWIRIVQLVRDFFRKKNNLIVGRAHYKLSRTCIRYLAMKEFAQVPEEFAEELAKNGSYNFPRFRSKYPLLNYATNQWMTHKVRGGMSHRTTF